MKTVQPFRRIGKASLIFTSICIFASLLPQESFAQTIEPQRDQLLNGLRILLLTRPGDQNVLLKLRINSGAAFDPAGKAGTMALLGDILFPDAATHDYFKDEMGGRLEVETNYDAINVTLLGRSADYDRIVDVMRAALVTTLITPENVAKVRDARIKALSDAKPSASEIANRAVAERLLGTFPYANAPSGTVETVARIERADLMLARDKFLSPNNATLVIIGGVDQRKAMRALRQLLGGWRKSDQLVPATFRQPSQPDPRTLIANAPGTQVAEVRLVTRGLARSDRDYFAATLLAASARDRWQKQLDEKSNLIVRHEAHALPGMFLMSASVDNAVASQTLESARKVLKSLVDSPVSSSELQKARDNSSAPGALANNDALADALLDIEAYALPAIGEQTRAWNSLTPADLQRVATRLFSEAAIATVVVGNAEDLKKKISPDMKIEVLGEVKLKAPESTTAFEPPKKRTPVILPPPKITNPLMKSTKPATKP